MKTARNSKLPTWAEMNEALPGRENEPNFLQIPQPTYRKPYTPEELSLLEERRKLNKLFTVRARFECNGWRWGAAAEYLYAALITAFELDHYKDELLKTARRRGRKRNEELFMRIHDLKGQGKTAREIQEILNAEGTHELSLEGVESYQKTRRKNLA